MLDARGYALTGLIFLCAWCLPALGNALLGPACALLVSCAGVCFWICKVPALPGFFQGIICLNGLALLLAQASVWLYCALAWS